MKFFNKLANWYFSKKALPYWGVLLFDSMVVLCCYLLVYAIKKMASTMKHIFLGTPFYLQLYFT